MTHEMNWPQDLDGKHALAGEGVFKGTLKFTDINMPPVFTITADGKLVFGEGVTPEDAARAIEKAYNTVREMTVEQVAAVIHKDSHDCNWTQAMAAARALAKLGCIRIKE